MQGRRDAGSSGTKKHIALACLSDLEGQRARRGEARRVGSHATDTDATRSDGTAAMCTHLSGSLSIHLALEVSTAAQSLTRLTERRRGLARKSSPTEPLLR